MGRNVAGLRIDKKSDMVNDKSNGVAPKALPEENYESSDHDAKDRSLSDESNEKQEVLGVKSTNHEPLEKIIKTEAHKSPDKRSTKPASGSAVNGTFYANGAQNDSPTSNDIQLGKKSLANSHFMSRKQPQPSCKNYYDEEDNWSLASSTATSVRTKITVPVAPRFTCVDRLQRRKEFYTKLEEKHRALEKEKLEYEARTKEEEQAAIKQLRKNMVVKANPVPSFYREGPPPKVELKKLPVTRAKSPNLTRRKSCGDVPKSSPDDKALCGRAARHSVGIYKASPVQRKASPVAAKTKDQTVVRKSNGSNNSAKNRPQQFKKGPIENSPVKREQENNNANGDIAVES